ncbi:Phage lysis protein, holin [compost metagenome]
MDKASLIRTIILVIALANQVLVASGKSPLPIEDSSVELLVSTILTIAASLWTWWKNNYISKKGKAQKAALKRNDLV